MKRSWFPWLFSLCFTVLLFAVLEWIAAEYVSLPGDFLEPDPVLNHVRPQNVTVHYSRAVAGDVEWSAPYEKHFNAQGWANSRDISQTKDLGVFRIFYLGDSFVEGTVPEEQTLTFLVEEGLRHAGDLNIEVINAGTVSYSPLLYYLRIRNEILKYSPDLIVFTVDMTDMFDDWKYRQVLRLDELGNPKAVPPQNWYEREYVETKVGVRKRSLWHSLQMFLYEHSSLFNGAIRIAQTIRQDRLYEAGTDGSLHELGIPSRWAWCSPKEWDQLTTECVNFTKEMISLSVELCKAHGIQVLLTAVPHYEQFALGENGEPLWSSRPHIELEQLAKSLEIPYLNAFEALKSTIRGTEQEEYYLRGDMHFNPRGYKVWAEAHIQKLREILSREST